MRNRRKGSIVCVCQWWRLVTTDSITLAAAGKVKDWLLPGWLSIDGFASPASPGIEGLDWLWLADQDLFEPFEIGLDTEPRLRQLPSESSHSQPQTPVGD